MSTGYTANQNPWGGGIWTPGATPGMGNTSTTTFTPSPGVSDPNAALPYQVLSKKLNDFMAQQAKSQFTSNLPDYSSMVGQRSTNTGAQLRGEVPQDVISQLIQSGSERGISTGSPGSPNANSAYLRALGLTSIGQQEAGSKSLSQGIADTPVSPLFNPGSLVVPDILGHMGFGAASLGLSRFGGLPYGGNNNNQPSYGGDGYSAPSPFTNHSANLSGTGGGTPVGGTGWTDKSPASPWGSDENWFDDVVFPGGQNQNQNQAGPSDFSDWFE